MILVSVHEPGDVPLARALLVALKDRYEIFLLFHSQGLLRAFEPTTCQHTTDLALCLLNAHNFTAAISFSGQTYPHLRANLTLLSCFNELGIPTLEIQHDLFQRGLDIDGPESGLTVRHAARDMVRWGGADGVGYPKSVLKSPAAGARHGSFVLITTNHGWHVYEDEDRYRLAIAIAKLIMSRPDTSFVWRPHDAEASSPSAAPIHEMLRSYRLANLAIETDLPADALVPACRAAISTPCTELLDYQAHEKPVLVFDCPRSRHLTRQLKAVTFGSYQELALAWAELEAAPRSCPIDTGIGPLQAEKLCDRLQLAIGKRGIHHDPLPIALRYVAQLPAPRTSIEKELKKTSSGLLKVIERLDALQRSTLAYKAKQAMKRWRKRGASPA